PLGRSLPPPRRVHAAGARAQPAACRWPMEVLHAPTSAGGGEVPTSLCGGRFEVLREVPVATNQPQFYEGCDTDDAPVAIRLERRKLGGRLEEEPEARILQALASPSLPQGFCAVRFWGLGRAPRGIAW
ncbi:unnamed protein product, partial [Prorocentrum cordatum]